MNGPEEIDWAELQMLAHTLAAGEASPGAVPEQEWRKIETALNRLRASEDWTGIVRLRLIYAPLIARDSVAVLPLFKRLSREAIIAAEQVGDMVELAHFWGAEGHNLHRQGYHQEAIKAFQKSCELYHLVDKTYEALQNFFMTSLCYRALEDWGQARRILEEVLSKVDKNDLWRANPLQVMAWLARDEGRLQSAERQLREALQLFRQTPNSDILVAGTLTDLAELIGLQGRIKEAEILFEAGLAVLKTHEGQYDRQEARTKTKWAELKLLAGENEAALRLLNQADDKIRGYGHYYDLLWRIELTKAFIFLRQGKWGSSIRKIRMALYYRQRIGLSNSAFARRLLGRMQLWLGGFWKN